MLLALMVAESSLSASPGSRIFASSMLLLFFLGTSFVLIRRHLFRSRSHTLAAIVLVFLALCLRLSLLDHPSGDYVSFLSVWTETMRSMSIREALSAPIGDYNMPYLYLILLISRLPFSDLYCIKLVSILADLAAALALAKLANLVTSKQNTLLLVLAAALLCPTTWLNSAYWGQCDSIYGALALWGLLLGLQQKSYPALVFFSLSLAFKLQAIFLLPILIFLLVTDRIPLKSLWVFPATFLAAMLPALLGGRSFSDTFSIYFSQTQAYPYLSLNAPSFWCLIDNQYFHDLYPAALLLSASLVLLVIYCFLRRSRRLDSDALIELSLIFSLMIPWLLPKMHERYFYLAEMLSILYAACYPRRAPVTVILTFGGFLIYSAYLFGEVPILSMRLIAVVYGVLLLYLLARLSRRLTEKKSPAAQKNMNNNDFSLDRGDGK